MSSNKKMEGKWSSLPSDILIMIAQRLIDNHEIEILYLRAVCSSWRASVPPSRNSPFQISFTKPIDNNNNVSKFFQFIVKQKTLLLITPLDNNADSAAPWIIQVVETGPKKLLIFDHFLSVFFPKHEHPDHINLLDYRVTEIHRSYYDVKIRNSPPSRFYYSDVRKVIFVTDGIIKAYVDDDRLTMFVLFEDGRVALWKSEPKDRILISEIDILVSDIVRFKNKIYATSKHCTIIISIDLVTLKVESVPCLDQSIQQKCYLAEFNGCFYQVTYNFYFAEKSGIQVIRNLYAFVLNEENECWDRKYDLDRGVFIVFEDCMISGLARDLYLPRSKVIFYVRFKDNHQLGGKMNGCSILYDLKSHENIVYYWGQNWPPPNWVKEMSKMSQLLKTSTSGEW